MIRTGIRVGSRSSLFKSVVAVHDLVGFSAVGESDVCANTLEQKQHAPITTSTQPKTKTFEARQTSADERATEADRA